MQLAKLKRGTARIFGSIRFQMVIIYLVVTVLAFLSISYFVSSIMEEFLVAQRTQQQAEQVSRLAVELCPVYESGEPDELYSLISQYSQELGGRVLVLDTDAVVQADSASEHNGLRLPYREVRDVLIGGEQTSYGFHSIVHSLDSSSDNVFAITNTINVWAVYYTAPLTQAGEIRGAVLFAAMIQDVADSVGDVLERIVMIFTGVALLIAVISFVLSGWLTKPVLLLTGAIRRMGRQGTGVRVKVRGKGELAELGDAFNRMSQQIEDHDRVRDEFVSNASHELKTPLAAMKVLAESVLYQENPDPAMMKEFFSDVDHEVDRLTSVINDLLRLVQDDQQTQIANVGVVELGALARRVAVRLTPLAYGKNLELRTKISDVQMVGDAGKLEQVLMNLVDNAIKYTDEGWVQLSVYSDSTYAHIDVSDTGIGIPEESKGHLFERFYRVDKARSRSTGGTGLGLSIVERIVANHGGYISVESREGEGSTFAVTLPLTEGGDAH